METKGLIKTLEAVIAVLLILGLVLFILPQEQQTTGEVPVQVKIAQDFVLEEIALNKVHRACVLNANEGACEIGCLAHVKSLMLQSAPYGYTASCEVCDSALSCAALQLPTEKSIYTDSIFISKKPAGNAVTKVVRVYYYEK